MDAQKLRFLLRSNEKGTLEFKREWYKIKAENKPTADRQKAELVKDILSLANGNAIVAGEEAYLVIGADNELNSEGIRVIYDVGELNPPTLQILRIVNGFCDPALEEILCDNVTLDEKRLLVITIPPSPHLYETRERLDTPGRSFDKHTVFVRHSDGIDTASAKERAQILKLKQITFSERRNPSPLPFGTVVGAIAGGAIASSLAGEKLVASKGNWPVSGFVGMSLGGFLGWSLGFTYQNYYEIRSKWFRIPSKFRVVAAGAGLIGAAGGWLAIKMINAILGKWTTR